MRADHQVRALAYYLPQFHRIPENDRWWGPEFTEWTTVRAARSLFPGHWQPKRPGELGFYDLRDDRVREQQAQLALEAGIDGFIYWHYWFAGRRLLETPSEQLLATGKPRFGFCFAWANTSWSRAWTGNHRDVLVEQEYPGAEDYRSHYRHLQRAFDDERYVRVGDRPLFLIFRPGDIPDLRVLVDVWHEEASRNGHPRPYLVGEADFTRGRPSWLDINEPLLDGVVDFSWIRAIGEVRRVLRHLPGRRRPLQIPYTTMQERLSVRQPDLPITQIPLVLTGWDNTPRYGPAGVVANAYTPATLEAAIKDAYGRAQYLAPPERFLVLKSWNEWSEGNYLEPDEHYGHAWIDACRRALGGL